MGANIIDVVFLERKHDFYRIRIEIHVSDVQHLLNIITSIEADTDIAEVLRFRETKVSTYERARKIEPTDSLGSS